MRKEFKIALIIGLIFVCFLVLAILILPNGKFFKGYYLAYEVNEDKETCTITKNIPFGAKEIVIPETIGRYRVTAIDTYAFVNRKTLTNVSLPNSVTSIGMGAFYGCQRLAEVSIPNGITNIGPYAFYGCSGLTSITLPETLTDIGAHAFDNCEGLTTATLPTSAIHALPSANIISVVVNGGTSIVANAFRNFKSLTSITISPSVQSVGEGAFEGCNMITHATIPACVTSAIPKTRLTRVVINGGTHIEEKAFYYSSALTSVTLPQSLTSIGNQAFASCYKLVEVYNLSSLNITKGSTEHGGIGRYALDIHTSTEEESNTWVTEDGYVFYQGDEVSYLLGYIGKETELILPSDCNGKNYVIHEFAFYTHAGLTAVTIPTGVTAIENFAFMNCAKLSSMTFPDGLVSIGNSAFADCDQLVKINIGKDITQIGKSAFDDCDNLSLIFYRGTTEEWSQVETGENWTYYAPADKVICNDGAALLN